VVPLGDSFERRRLIILTAAGSAVALVVVALSSDFRLLIASSFILGTVSVTPQLVVPYAAGLVPIENRGRVVGVVMSGLLVGILLSRTLSGFLNAVTGWRGVYLISASMVLELTVLLAFSLPKQSPEQKTHHFHYGRLLGSLLVLARNEPGLRRHAIIGACGFSAFWTTLAFHLRSLPAHYGSATVGLFGIFGAAGALVAPLAGRLADRHTARHVNGLALALVIVSFLLMAAGGQFLLALAVGVVLMDAGVQGSHISNQTRIYALHPALRNRLNSVYMFTYFLGGTIGSVLGAWSWSYAGWQGVCICATILTVFGLVTLFARTVGLLHHASTSLF
jgi:predicted MFS family arabinose efflux permease